MTLQSLEPYAILAWPLITALCSLGYSRVDRTSRGHAVLSFLASLGLDLPKLIQTLQRIIEPGVPVMTASKQDPIIVHRDLPPPTGGFGEPSAIAELRVGQMFPPPSNPPPGSTLRRSAFAFGPLCAAVLTLAGCTKVQAKTATDAAGNACEVIFSALDPSVAPLCTTAAAVADAVEALIGTHAAVVTGPGAAPYKPSAAEVYTYLSAHGAAKVITQ